jgi:hypothetical protein
MPLSRYIDEHVVGGGGGYLAQHELFEQVKHVHHCASQMRVHELRILSAVQSGSSE